MNNDQKRTVIAFTLSIFVLFAWQHFFGPKPTEQAANQPTPVAEVKTEKTSNQVVENKPVAPAEVQKPVVANLPSVELVNGDYRFTVTSNFALAAISGYKVNLEELEFTGKEKAFQVYYVNQSSVLVPFNLAFEEIANSSTVTGYDQASGMKVTFKLDINGKLSYKITADNPFQLTFKVTSSEKQSANRTYRQFVVFHNDITRINVEDDEKGEGKMKWYALDFQHHALFNAFPNKVKSTYSTNENGELFVQLLDSYKSFDGYFLYSLKNYDFLSSFKDKLDLSIDFGLFGIIAVPILRGMQFIFKYVGNYGIAIIILTFLIRFVTYPLQFKSFKSMKKMQVVQPEIQKIKEKYKDDPAKVQRETMELFKRAGANPLGGCLPMLLQVPIFIAFYQAINNSVELVGSPFALWIHDLSAKDPYYVLPVLMGITMLLQTKLNPSTTTDPNQQKIMYIMPLVFCFIMKDLPAGLNLYFFISNVLGIAQQLYVYKTVEA
jgi:YidC/Oxa1 family membrane protein insertase